MAIIVATRGLGHVRQTCDRSIGRWANVNYQSAYKRQSLP